MSMTNPMFETNAKYLISSRACEKEESNKKPFKGITVFTTFYYFIWYICFLSIV